MSKLKRVWISGEAYKQAKINAAESESKLVDYFDKVLTGKEPKQKGKRGYYGFLK